MIRNPSRTDIDVCHPLGFFVLRRVLRNFRFGGMLVETKKHGARKCALNIGQMEKNYEFS